MYESPVTGLPIPDTTLTAHVLAGAHARGDRTALIDASTGERLSYAELARAVVVGARQLVHAGVRSGDVVALVSQNQPRYPVALHAVLTAGGAVAPLNPNLTVEELRRYLRASKAGWVVTAVEVAEKVRQAWPGGRERILVMGGPAFSDLAVMDDHVTLPTVHPSTTIALLPLSSGTTGAPKAVCLTHRNLVSNLEQTRAGWRISDRDVQAAVLPFFHAYGLNIVLNAGLLAGASIVTMPRFDLAAYLDIIERFRVTRAYLVPPIVHTLATSPLVEQYDLSSLSYVLCGAAPLDPETTQRAERRIGCHIRQGYGLTEASPGTHQVIDADFAATPAGSVGTLSPDTQARVVRLGTDIDVSPGEPGELLIRGPQVMMGYLDDEAANAAAFHKGWLRTGDLVRVDETDRFWIVDRSKEIIKCNGFQVAPAELEAVLRGHPAVFDVAVVGRPDPVAGEVPVAFVVPALPLDVEALLRWVRERVATYKRIHAVELVTEIPKSATGKILRRVLRDSLPVA